MKVDFYVNASPKGGRVEVSPSSGSALVDEFYVSTTGWSDIEENYPLRYQFCCRDGSAREICFTALIFEAYSLRKLFWGCTSVVAKVMDTVGGENQTSVLVQISPYFLPNRALAASDLTTSFLEDIDDPENTPSMVSTYSRSVPVDQTLFSAMTSAMNEYADTRFQVTPQVLTALLGAQSSFAGQNITKQTRNGDTLLLLLNKTLTGYAEEVTEEQLTQLFEIASVSASSNPALYASITSTAVGKYYVEKLPSSTGFHFATPVFEYFTLRQVSAAHSSISLQNATISLPSDWFKNARVVTTDILDLHVEVNITGNSTAITLFARKSGTYSNYNVQLGSGESLNLINPTLPYNVSVSHYLGNHTLECVGLDSHQNWTTSLCSVISSTTTTAIISTQSFTSFLLRPAYIPLPPSDTPITTAPIATSDTEDSVNPAPVIIVFFLFIIEAVIYVLFRVFVRNNPLLGDEKKSPDNEMFNLSHSEKPSAIEENSNAQPVPNPPTVGDIADGQKEVPNKKWIEAPQGDILVPIELLDSPRSQNSLNVSKKGEPVESQEAKTPTVEVTARELHSVLGLWKRPEMIAELICVLIAEILVLGVCYKEWFDSESTASSAEEVFRSYSGDDMKYVGVALACGTVLSLFSLLRSGVVALGSAVLSGLEFGVVLYFNYAVSFEEGGRWAIGVLITLAVHLLVIETVKTFVVVLIKWLGKRISKRNSSS